MEIVKYPAPVLETPGKKIAEITDEIRERVREMFAVMYEARGVGLAAPQVGWGVRIFVCNRTGDPEETDEELVLVNPEIVQRSGREIGEEGCLSFPGLTVHVARATRVKVRFVNLDGETCELETDDPFLARILQHENDHLDGILFITRMTPADRLSAPVQKKLRELRAQPDPA